MIIYYNAVMVKINSAGEMIWEKTWRRNGLPSYFYFVVEMHDGNYALCGGSYRCMGDNYDCLSCPHISVFNKNGELKAHFDPPSSVSFHFGIFFAIFRFDNSNFLTLQKF